MPGDSGGGEITPLPGNATAPWEQPGVNTDLPGHDAGYGLGMVADGMGHMVGADASGQHGQYSPFVANDSQGNLFGGAPGFRTTPGQDFYQQLAQFRGSPQSQQQTPMMGGDAPPWLKAMFGQQQAPQQPVINIHMHNHAPQKGTSAGAGAAKPAGGAGQSPDGQPVILPGQPTNMQPQPLLPAGQAGTPQDPRIAGPQAQGGGTQAGAAMGNAVGAPGQQAGQAMQGMVGGARNAMGAPMMTLAGNATLAAVAHFHQDPRTRAIVDGTGRPTLNRPGAPQPGGTPYTDAQPLPGQQPGTMPGGADPYAVDPSGGMPPQQAQQPQPPAAPPPQPPPQAQSPQQPAPSGAPAVAMDAPTPQQPPQQPGANPLAGLNTPRPSTAFDPRSNPVATEPRPNMMPAWLQQMWASTHWAPTQIPPAPAQPGSAEPPPYDVFSQYMNPEQQ